MREPMTLIEWDTALESSRAEAAMLREALERCDQIDQWSMESDTRVWVAVCGYCGAVSADMDVPVPHDAECPTQIARTALSTTGSDWLDKHDTEKDATIAGLSAALLSLHEAYMEDERAMRDEGMCKRIDSTDYIGEASAILARRDAEVRRKALVEAVGEARIRGQVDGDPSLTASELEAMAKEGRNA